MYGEALHWWLELLLLEYPSLKSAVLVSCVFFLTTTYLGYGNLQNLQWNEFSLFWSKLIYILTALYNFVNFINSFVLIFLESIFGKHILNDKTDMFLLQRSPLSFVIIIFLFVSKSVKNYWPISCRKCMLCFVRLVYNEGLIVLLAFIPNSRIYFPFLYNGNLNL